MRTQSAEARSWVLSLANFYGDAVYKGLVIGGATAFHQERNFLREDSGGGFGFLSFLGG
jgi:hypothetical protein